MLCPVFTGFWGTLKQRPYRALLRVNQLSKLRKEGLLVQHRKALNILTSDWNKKKKVTVSRLFYKEVMHVER